MGVFSLMNSRCNNLLIVGLILIFVVCRPLIPFPVCPSRYLMSAPCPTCGLTTAFRLILTGNFLKGLEYNWTVLPVLLIIARTTLLQFNTHQSIRSKLESHYCELLLLASFIIAGFCHGLSRYL